MTDREQATAEIRALLGEAVGALSVVAQSSGTLTKRAVRNAINEAMLRLERARLLSDRLP